MRSQFAPVLMALLFCLGQPHQVSAQDTGVRNPAAQVGVSAVVRGQVQLARGEAIGRRIGSGEALFLDDAITSGPRSGMQILLMDETVFTIGPDSELTIDEFVYDPGTDNGQIVASVTKGVFRFITGKIAKKRPEDMTVKLPVGTIGIRGTIVGGVVTPTGTEIVLLGPGAVNNAGETVGRIEVSNEFGTVSIARSGFGTTLTPGAPPTPPKAVPSSRVQQLTGTLSEDSDSNAKDEGADGASNGASSAQSAESASGQGIATSFERAVEVKKVEDTQEDSDENSEEASELTTINAIVDGATSTVDQLNGLTGTAHFFQTSNLSDGGTYDITLDVNFDSRTIGGGNSKVDVNSTNLGTGSFNILTNDFSTGSNGLAVFDAQNSINFTCSTATNCIGAVEMTLKNANGGVAGRLDHNVTLTDNPVTQTVTGSGSTSDRSNGLAPG